MTKSKRIHLRKCSQCDTLAECKPVLYLCAKCRTVDGMDREVES